ncbi:SulP family inorganic anion transporter [Paraburkholderia sp. SIMBA_054]|uniref:SulP family inorganic anion transporter n=1 Tax=Paraburkholderia sp. SIMBA_054 TaxID=3085795 RepID=UPI00397A0D72
MALVSLTDVSILSRTYERRNGISVNRNRECIALGLSNMAAGVLQGFAVSASGSRTPVAESAGAKTQVTGVIAAAVVALLLVFAPRSLAHAPQSALAAVVIAACVAVIEVRGVIRLYRLWPSEFAQCMVCFAGVACLGRSEWHCARAAANRAVVPVARLAYRVIPKRGVDCQLRWPPGRQLSWPVDGVSCRCSARHSCRSFRFGVG